MPLLTVYKGVPAAGQKLRELLEGHVHPAVIAAWFAPVDDEPVTEADLEAIAKGRASLEEKGGLSQDEIKQHHGIV